LDRRLSERFRPRFSAFDVHSHPLLPATDLAGSNFIEYIDYYGVFDDVPWQLIVEKLPEYYSSGLDEWFTDEPAYIRYKRSGSGIG